MTLSRETGKIPSCSWKKKTLNESWKTLAFGKKFVGVECKPGEKVLATKFKARNRYWVKKSWVEKNVWKLKGKWKRLKAALL